MPVSDQYSSKGIQTEAQPRGGLSITPSDYIDLPTVCKAIYVGTAGDISVVTANGSVQQFNNVPVGVLPVQVKRVNSTGTTASQIVGFMDDYLFTPASIAGLNLWFDASDLSTLTLDSSDIVQQWNNKVAGGSNLVKSVNGGPKYLKEASVANALPALFWEDAIGKRGLEFPDDSEVAINNLFMVMSYKDGNDATFDDTHTVITNLYAKGTSPVDSVSRVVGGNGTGSLSTSFAITSASKNGAPTSGAVLPLPLTSVRFALSNFQLHNIFGSNTGASRNWRGYLCEVIAFNSSTTLTAGQIMSLHEYLKNKWRL